MSCCEGWTSCNGFGLLVLLLLGVILNAIPLVMNLLEEDQSFQNPISCFEGWFPGIIGAGLMVIPATTMALAARKRQCCNNRTGMFLSSLFSVITIIGAVYCMLVSLQALSEGPLVCSSQANSSAKCEFSFKNLSDIHPESFTLQWFYNNSCILPILNNPTFNTTTSQHTIVHFSVFLGLLLVGILEVLFGLSQIVIGFLGCLCGVSKRNRPV
ncbi:transmembrane 4 L6 family member 20 [Nycticebus coucang]|uniref:transmembrane 4 L6 family member 20 n=1 Tax=Nycticebus coucang TaxID=9470 RepID=UPI00234CFC4B|nr:transmembrane 4 L6 family member 20 [Nycticebus coucang]